MKNSKLFIDINAKDGTVVVSQALNNGSETLEVQQFKDTYEGDGSMAILRTIAGVFNSLTEQEWKDRITIIIPENVAIRIYTGMAARKKGGNVIAAMVKPWMPKAWVESIGEFVEAWESWLSLGGSVNFFNARQLYYWSVVKSGDDYKNLSLKDLNGKTVTFVNGVSEELGLVVSDNQYYNATAELRVTAIKGQDGSERYLGTVPRFLTVKGKDGENVKMTSFAASSDLSVECVSDAHTLILNATRLHVTTAQALPRHKTVKKIVVNTLS